MVKTTRHQRLTRLVSIATATAAATISIAACATSRFGQVVKLAAG